MGNGSFPRQPWQLHRRGGRDSPSQMDAEMQHPLTLCCSLGCLFHPALPIGAGHGAVWCPGPHTHLAQCPAWRARTGTSLSVPGHHLPLGFASEQRCAHGALCTEISFKDNLGGGKQPGHCPDVSFNPFAVCPVYAALSHGKCLAMTLSLCPCSPSAWDRRPGEGAGPGEAAGHLRRLSHPACGEGAL